MFNGDDWHTIKEALIFVMTWKVLESIINYLSDKIPAIYRQRNSAAARRLAKVRQKNLPWKRGKEPVIQDGLIGEPGVPVSLSS